jgi:DNA-binding response OmpR family regulator
MHVLVVEDDRALAQFLQKGLLLEGHTVDLAGDGEAALQQAEEHAPDLMVLDLKPFSFHELMARCRAILRRRERGADPLLRFGAIEIDRLQRRVRYGGADLELTGKEYALLEVLVRRQGACCSRIALLAEVWNGTTEGGTNIVDVYVTYLRKKLAAARPADRMSGSAIETVRGSGYRLRPERRMADGPAIGRREGDLPMDLARGA